MWTQICLPLLTGLSIFMFGMKMMEWALHAWAGPMLKKTMETSTKTPLRGLLTGMGMTALLQSSSAITVITIGMVNAGILTFPRTLGIILGTNIGTCITTELIGLNLDQIALPLLIVSMTASTIIWLIRRRLTLRSERSRRRLQMMNCLSLALAGFACIMIGMQVMQTIVPELQSRGLFTWFLQHSQKSLLWGIVAGAALTAIIQSSTAAIAMTMGLASMQAISVDLGIAIILGANIGTCATAMFASIGGSLPAQFVAWSHVILNVGGAIVFYPLVPLLQAAVALMAEAPSAQLAHAQTIYNIVCSLAALPICYWPRLQQFRAP